MMRLVKAGRTTLTHVGTLLENKVLAASLLIVWILSISFLPNLTDFRRGVTHLLFFATFFFVSFIAKKILHQFENHRFHFIKSFFAYLIVAPVMLIPLAFALALSVNTPGATETISESVKEFLILYTLLGLPMLLMIRYNLKASKS